MRWSHLRIYNTSQTLFLHCRRRHQEKKENKKTASITIQIGFINLLSFFLLILTCPIIANSYLLLSHPQTSPFKGKQTEKKRKMLLLVLSTSSPNNENPTLTINTGTFLCIAVRVESPALETHWPWVRFSSTTLNIEIESICQWRQVKWNLFPIEVITKNDNYFYYCFCFSANCDCYGHKMLLTTILTNTTTKVSLIRKKNSLLFVLIICTFFWGLPRFVPDFFFICFLFLLFLIFLNIHPLSIFFHSFFLSLLCFPFYRQFSFIFLDLILFFSDCFSSFSFFSSPFFFCCRFFFPLHFPVAFFMLLFLPFLLFPVSFSPSLLSFLSFSPLSFFSCPSPFFPYVYFLFWRFFLTFFLRSRSLFSCRFFFAHVFFPCLFSSHDSFFCVFFLRSIFFCSRFSFAQVLVSFAVIIFSSPFFLHLRSSFFFFFWSFFFAPVFYHPLIFFPFIFLGYPFTLLLCFFPFYFYPFFKF